MNKMIKGSVAGATGIALLMGGFGTYALWSQTVPANGGSISSGVLKIDSAGTGQWSDVSGSTPTSIADIGSFRMVPGDTVKLVQPLAVTATGTNIKAKLVVSGVDNGFAHLVVNAGYGANEVATYDATTGDYVATYDTTQTLQDLNEATEAVVTFELPESVNNQDDQNASIDLSKVKVTLQQFR